MLPGLGGCLYWLHDFVRNRDNTCVRPYSFWIYSGLKRSVPHSIVIQIELTCWAPNPLSMTIQGIRTRVSIVRETTSFLALLLVVESIRIFGCGVCYVWTTRVRVLAVCTSDSALRRERSCRLRSLSHITLWCSLCLLVLGLLCLQRSWSLRFPTPSWSQNWPCSRDIAIASISSQSSSTSLFLHSSLRYRQ